MLSNFYYKKKLIVFFVKKKDVMGCHAIMKHVTNQENTKYKDLSSDSLTEQLYLLKQFRIN